MSSNDFTEGAAIHEQQRSSCFNGGSNDFTKGAAMCINIRSSKWSWTTAVTTGSMAVAMTSQKEQQYASTSGGAMTAHGIATDSIDSTVNDSMNGTANDSIERQQLDWLTHSDAKRKGIFLHVGSCDVIFYSRRNKVTNCGIRGHSDSLCWHCIYFSLSLGGHRNRNFFFLLFLPLFHFVKL